MVTETCPICNPEIAVCAECSRVLTRSSHLFIFAIMEAVFGSSITFAAVGRNYIAAGIFAFAAAMSVTLAMKVKEDD